MVGAGVSAVEVERASAWNSTPDRIKRGADAGVKRLKSLDAHVTYMAPKCRIVPAVIVVVPLTVR